MFSENRDVSKVTWENMTQTDRQAGRQAAESKILRLRKDAISLPDY
jgi:hypothetical protein